MHLRKLFADDPERGERMTREAAGIFLDYSKNRITDETLELLLQLAEESGLRARIDAMFRGERINVTENRPVLHVALRAPKGASIVVDGENVVPQVHAVLDKMTDFSNRVRSGTWKGHTGKRIRNVINIGIGGSDLGPVMAYEALKHYSDRAMTFRDYRLGHRVRRPAVGLLKSGRRSPGLAGRSTDLILRDVAVAVRYPDGSFTLNGEPFSDATSIFRCTAASFLAGLALSVPPLTAAAVGFVLASVGYAAAARS